MTSDTADITNVDQKRLHLIYEKWPEYFNDASQISCATDHDEDFYRSILFCGMGGSGTCCDILNDLMHLNGKIPSNVVRNEFVPMFAGKHSLVIVNSVSGNTKETLSMMMEASFRGAEVICISSGGKLRDLAVANGHRHISIPNLTVPRTSLPFLLMPGLKLISPFITNSINQEIFSIPKNLENVAKTISLLAPPKFNLARKISKFLKDGYVFCFASPYLVSAATRFKNSLNENAKVHCTKESILEASHNEIVPFTFNNNYCFDRRILLLRWVRDSSFIRERFDKVSSFFTEIGQPWMEIDVPDESLINAIVWSIFVLDYSTIYMAVSRNLDPSSTPAIDILKKI